MNKRILHRAAGFLLAVVLVLGLAVPAFATTRRDAILAQMAANSAAWHTADAEGRKQLEAANQALRADLASLGNNDVSYNPATGVTTVTSKNTGSQVYSNTTVKDTSGNRTSTQTWVTSGGSTVTQTSNAGSGTIYTNRDNITSVGTDIKVTVTDQNGNVVTKNDTIYTTKGYDQNYTVVTQSNATTEAVNWCKQNGVPVNEQNVAAYISEHYTKATLGLTETDRESGTNVVRVDGNGNVSTEINVDRNLIFREMIKEALGTEAWESYDETFARIKDVENSEEIQALKKEWDRIENNSKLTPEQKKEQQNAIHEQAEAIRASYGYSAGSNGDYYIPTNGGKLTADTTPSEPQVWPSDPQPPVIVIDPTPDPVPPGGDTATVMVVKEGEGTVTPGSGSVQKGTDRTYTFTPAAGYEIADVVVDGVSKGAVTEYTLENIVADHVIKVVFKQITHEIKVSWKGDGSVTPGTTKVVEGKDQTFTIAPGSGQKIKGVWVDGVLQTSIGSPAQTITYTFRGVKKPHALYVEFVQAPVLELGRPSLSSNTLNSDGSIKAGYGFTASLPVAADGVTDLVVTASWDFGNGERGTVSLELGADGVYHFPVNSASKTGARKLYIPVATKDGDYYIRFRATAVDAAGETVTTDEAVVRFTVKGTMYEDDFTGDRR